jgi:hypothetical protein
MYMTVMLKKLRARSRVWRMLCPLLFRSEYDVKLLLEAHQFQPNDTY